jgi:hypothetical protein
MFQLSGILEFASEPSLLGRLYSLTGNGFRRIFNVHAFFLFRAILWFLLSLLSSSPWASIQSLSGFGYVGSSSFQVVF